MRPKKWSKRKIKNERKKEIQEELEKQGKDPNVAPKSEWLNENGFSGLFRGARREFELGPIECLIKVCGFRPRKTNDALQCADGETESLINQHKISLKRRGKLSENTVPARISRIRTLQSMLNKQTIYDSILTPARLDSGDGFRTLLTVFDALDDRLESDQSKLNYAWALRDFYAFCSRRDIIDNNPVYDILDEYGWTPDYEGETETLDAEQIYRMLLEANKESNSDEDLILVITICGWGFRPSDIVRLDITEHIYVNDKNPRVEFEERKNGPGTVPIMVGDEIFASFAARKREDPDWMGEIFTSPENGKNSSITRDTIRNRFKKIADNAEVELSDGSTPTPKNGRRFWYNLYQKAVTDWMLGAEKSAFAQASSSAETVDQNYLWTRLRNRFFRRKARDEFAKAFGDELVVEPEQDPLEVDAVEELEGYNDENILDLQEPNHSIDEYNNNVQALVSTIVDEWGRVSTRVAAWTRRAFSSRIENKIPRPQTPIQKGFVVLTAVVLALVYLRFMGVSIDTTNYSMTGPSGLVPAIVLYLYILISKPFDRCETM
jgi:site-specific recombinase XerD